MYLHAKHKLPKNNKDYYKCVIPKGSIYYVGHIGDIASNKIIIKEICV